MTSATSLAAEAESALLLSSFAAAKVVGVSNNPADESPDAGWIPESDNSSLLLLLLLPVELESVFGMELTPTVAAAGGGATFSLSLLIEETPPLGRKGVVSAGGGGATSCRTTALNL